MADRHVVDEKAERTQTWTARCRRANAPARGRQLGGGAELQVFCQRLGAQVWMGRKGRKRTPEVSFRPERGKTALRGPQRAAAVCNWLPSTCARAGNVVLDGRFAAAAGTASDEARSWARRSFSGTRKRADLRTSAPLLRRRRREKVPRTFSGRGGKAAVGPRARAGRSWAKSTQHRSRALRAPKKVWRAKERNGRSHARAAGGGPAAFEDLRATRRRACTL